MLVIYFLHANARTDVHLFAVEIVSRANMTMPRMRMLERITEKVFIDVVNRVY